MTMFSIEESRKMDDRLLAQLTGEWSTAYEVAKRADCSETMARDRLMRLAETGRCQWTDHRFRNGSNGTHVYRAVTTPAVAAARNDD
jgi:hypothetical protein